MPADLSARRFRNGLRPNHHDFARRQPIFLRDHLSKLRHDGFHGFHGFHGVSELHHDHQRLLSVARNGDRGDGTRLDLREQAARLLDVLRVVVAASHDQEVLRAAADVQLAVLCDKQTTQTNVEEAQIPRRQPFARLVRQLHAERLAVIREIAAGHRGGLHVDLSHQILAANRRFPRDGDPNRRVFRCVSARK